VCSVSFNVWHGNASRLSQLRLALQLSKQAEQSVAAKSTAKS